MVVREVKNSGARSPLQEADQPLSLIFTPTTHQLMATIALPHGDNGGAAAQPSA